MIDTLGELPDERVRAALDLGVAFEHIEPDRHHAIVAYQLAGPRRDRGRSRTLALEIGWWQAVGRLALVELEATSAPEALVLACRSLIDDDKRDEARRLLESYAAKMPEAALVGLRAELDGSTGDWKAYSNTAQQLRTPRAAGDAYVTAARLARAHGETGWARQLKAALEVDGAHPVATAMLLDLAVATADDGLVFEIVRMRLLGLDGVDNSDALRAIVSRLLLAKEPQHHAGLGRRLARVALERAYAAAPSAIPGHLALWRLLDIAATQDGQRKELLPLILRGLDLTLPAFDRTWLAALGADICIQVKERDTARTYAAIVAEHAPSHPVVLELLTHARAKTAEAVAHTAPDEPEELSLDDIEVDPVDAANDSPGAVLDEDRDIAAALDALAIDATPPLLESLVPDDIDLALGQLDWSGESVGAASTAYSAPPSSVSAPDPRFIDVRVRALDEDDAPAPTRRATTSWDVDAELFRRRAATPPAPAAPTPTEAAPAGPAGDVAATSEPTANATTNATTDASAVPPPPSVLAAGSTVPPGAPPLPSLGNRGLPSLPSLPRLKSPASPPAVTTPPSVAMSSPPSSPASSPPSVAMSSGLIPAAVARVLKKAGPPRPLSMVVPPINAKPRAERVPLPVDIVIRHEGHAHEVHSRDLSASGFFAISGASFTIGAIVECELRMPVAGALAATTFTVRATVMRRDELGYGLSFVEPSAALVAAIAAFESQ